jgi:hypothetical protein
MQFHIPLVPPPSAVRIRHRDPILLAGSCFTEHMSDRLRRHGFYTLDNPNGILFNPHSLATSLQRVMQPVPYGVDDLFHHDGLWASWDHHGRFAHPDPEVALEAINASLARAHAFLRNCRWLILTLGSAFVYRLDEGRIVANCHKVPAARFTRELLTAEAVIDSLSATVAVLADRHPDIRLIITVSPVRHLRDGFVDNNRSKAALITAAHALCERHPGVTYFPAYELVIDDLRDHRFYMEDMVHPNHLATEYVWERFTAAWVEPQAREAMKEVARLRTAMAHRPLHPGTAAHAAFRKAHLALAQDLAARLPWVDFTRELAFFRDDRPA